MASTSNQHREVAKVLIDRYFKTTPYPYTRHHIDSYDQFVGTDMLSIIQAKNPILILKDLINPEDNTYRYKVEIFVGGESGTEINIGTPTVSLQNTEDVRLLFPNEARLRNLTYSATVNANIAIKITYTEIVAGQKQVVRLDVPLDAFQAMPLFKLPVMLHSRYCVLHNKPSEFLKEAGECIEDYGGYFIVDGAEKILITKQEQAFNTLYITPKDADPKDPQMKIFSTISCLSAKTRQVKRVTIRLRTDGTILVGLPFVRDPVPLFILFRALGFQSDEEIMRLLFPDFEAADAKLLMPKLQPCILEAYPFINTWTSIQYIKNLTKGFSEIHVLDIIRNQMFIHMPNDPTSQALFLAECVRNILRVSEGYERATDRDDIRNQRCLVSGFLLQMLFNNAYNKWTKGFKLDFEREYEVNKGAYRGEEFRRIFDPAYATRIFGQKGRLTEIIMRGFKGHWDAGLGEEKAGVLQSLSRLSYTDFMSHCRRVVLEFDTTMKLQGPRRLHGSQYGYFCTSETPGGSSIGISKNMSILTAFSLATPVLKFTEWLYKKGHVYVPDALLDTQRIIYVPVFLNGGILGMTAKPLLLTKALKVLKRSGYLPYSAGISFSIQTRRVNIYLDAGRPLRPLLWVEGGVVNLKRVSELKTWAELVTGMKTNTDADAAAVATGTPIATIGVALSNTLFVDPFEDENLPLETYIERLQSRQGCIEYIDPYEQNEAYIANFPEQVVAETTHVEVHPSTILSMMTTLIPFCQHNQSPRNQLGDSQSKQAVSMYATNWNNRFDNSAHVLCYGESPLCRTIYTNYLGEGRMPYGQNIILAIAFWSGYNQDDGIVFNQDAFERGLFRSMAYRSYEIREEDDIKTHTKIRIGNPASPSLGAWKDLRPGLNYNKLDEDGIIKVGEWCDENTVIVGAYMMDETGRIKDHSLTPQVWTRGRVEKVVITVSNMNQRLVKIRVAQDRIPELGDKFCLTEDHEVLTGGGWKSIKDVTLTDSVCTLNDKHEIEYHNPTHTYEFDCQNENLYHIDSQQVDLLTTMNHKMYVKKRNASTFSLIEAKDIHGKRVQYKKDGMNMNLDYQLVLDGTLSLNMDAFLEWFGYWISDGWVSKSKTSEYRIEVCLCVEKDRERFTELSSAMGLNVYPNTDSTKLFISNKQLATYLYEYSKGAIHKSFPEWVWQLSERQTRLLIKGLIAGDGTVMKNGVERFFTSSVTLSDQFQRICLHAGWSASKKKIYDAGTPFVIKGKKTQANADYWGLTINKHKNTPMVNHGHTHTQQGQKEEIVPFTGKVYCIQVPSHIFYVRRNGKPVWTGNSNRHGQKGTIGAMLRGHDMPRSASGIIPDMIMNPHAIPSRMTIAQNLEQLFGKAVATAGTVADCTAFMNDGSPEAAIGAMLEGFGCEKYGNEILYNGATGEQISAAIFVGPVYGMRLKHMVEDKWQARGQGRKEQMTHQPTGGRGAQGGLKIGEMDRDSIICHGITSFVTESFMKRSDGTKVPLCTSCGTVPIYNPKLGISFCTLCNGPPEYIGDTERTLELLPPLSRQKGEIVEVEMPYATKVVTQELAAIMNIGLRMITTADVQKLQPFEMSAKTSDVVETLTELVFPEIIMPAILPERPTETITLDELAASAADLGALVRAEARTADEQPIRDEEFDMAAALAAAEEYVPPPPQQLARIQQQYEQQQQQQQQQQQPILVPQQAVSLLPPLASVQPQQVFVPSANEFNVGSEPLGQGDFSDLPPLEGEGQGGQQIQAGGYYRLQAPLPSGPITLAIDTSPSAMAAQGLMFPGQQNQRPVRRSFGGYQQRMYSPMDQQQQSQQSQQQQQQHQGSGANRPIVVQKLE